MLDELVLNSRNEATFESYLDLLSFYTLEDWSFFFLVLADHDTILMVASGVILAFCFFCTALSNDGATRAWRFLEHRPASHL